MALGGRRASAADCADRTGHERVDVDVKVHRSAPGSPLRGLCAVGWKALHDGHSAAATVDDAGLASDMAQEPRTVRTYTSPRPRGTGCDSRPARSAGDAADSGPTPTPKPGEAARLAAAAQKIAELLFDEPRQPLAVSERGRRSCKVIP